MTFIHPHSDPAQTRRPMRKASPISNQRRIRRKQTAETNRRTQRKFLMHSVSNSGPAGTPGPPPGPLGTPGPNTGKKGAKSCLLRPKIGFGAPTPVNYFKFPLTRHGGYFLGFFVKNHLDLAKVLTST